MSPKFGGIAFYRATIQLLKWDGFGARRKPLPLLVLILMFTMFPVPLVFQDEFISLVVPVMALMLYLLAKV
jgi:hypothetical protein